jgi:CRP/FNR family transcriptional regulator, cyclic AMP receptor protein
MAKGPKFAFDPKVFLGVVGRGRIISKYRKGDIVFRQGDPGDAVFFIEKGRVKISVVSKQGKEAIIAFLGPGDFLGEGCLGSRTRRISTASAMTECTITRVTKSMMMKTLRDEPKFSQLFTSHLLARAIRFEDDLIDQLFNSSEKRLARTLVLLAHYGNKDTPELVIPKVSQATLAEIIGTTRSRVSHFMNRFRKLGLIDYDGVLRVHSSLLDVVLHEQPHAEKNS